MKNYLLDMQNHLDMADAFKPGDETAERAQIEATIALAYGLAAIAERIDSLVDEISLPIDSQGCLRVDAMVDIQ